jgi:hypothetical protein
VAVVLDRLGSRKPNEIVRMIFVATLIGAAFVEEGFAPEPAGPAPAESVAARR